MKLVQCPDNGPSPYCLICQHLREQHGLGYFAIQAEPDAPGQAWCEACDAVLAHEHGWSDLADRQAGWKLFFTACYEDRLNSHALVSWVEGEPPEA